MITEVIEQKMADSARIRKRKAKMMQANNPQKEKNIFKKGFKSLKGMLQTKEAKQSEELRANQSLIFNELSKFVNFFVNFGLSLDSANDLLL